MFSNLDWIEFSLCILHLADISTARYAPRPLLFKILLTFILKFLVILISWTWSWMQNWQRDCSASSRYYKSKMELDDHSRWKCCWKIGCFDWSRTCRTWWYYFTRVPSWNSCNSCKSVFSNKNYSIFFHKNEWISNNCHLFLRLPTSFMNYSFCMNLFGSSIHFQTQIFKTSSSRKFQWIGQSGLIGMMTIMWQSSDIGIILFIYLLFLKWIPFAVSQNSFCPLFVVTQFANPMHSVKMTLPFGFLCIQYFNNLSLLLERFSPSFIQTLIGEFFQS